MTTQSTRFAIGEFPPPIAISPVAQPHEFTIIFLHGRGFNADKFHRPLLQTRISDALTFQEAFPRTRFVFPTAPLSRATKYRRTLMHQWYDGTGDWEPEARGGMRPSVEYIHDLIRREIEMVGGDAKRVVLAGFSQGCAMALMSGLLWDGDHLGAFVGLCGFIPLANHLLSILNGDLMASEDDGFEFCADEAAADAGESSEPLTMHQVILDQLREEVELSRLQPSPDFQFSPIPVFLGHGCTDPEVETRHASQAASLLGKTGMDVEFHTYDGLQHWYSPEMLMDVVEFLEKHLNIQPNTT